MKNSIVILLIVLFSSCCNAKKATQESTILKEKAVAEIKTDTIPILVEDQKEVATSKTEAFPLPPKPPIQIENSTFSHKRWNTLLQKHVSPSGNVNYQKFKADKAILDLYIDDLAHNTPKSDWSKTEKLAYWINAYNALTIDLIIKNYPIKSIKDIKDPWGQELWELGDKWYSLEDIEHEILRKMDEPRIHFAIVCASYSCPKLQNTAFTASNLETQLTAATKQFLSDTKRNEIKENSLKLSKIFKWFDKDFEQNGTLIDFLNKYTDVNISAKAKISYKDYNWDLNN